MMRMHHHHCGEFNADSWLLLLCTYIYHIFIMTHDEHDRSCVAVYEWNEKSFQIRSCPLSLCIQRGQGKGRGDGTHSKTIKTGLYHIIHISLSDDTNSNDHWSRIIATVYDDIYSTFSLNIFTHTHIYLLVIITGHNIIAYTCLFFFYIIHL